MFTGSPRRPQSASAAIDLIFDIFLHYDVDSYLGEAVTMSEHMLQCAWLAAGEQADDELVAAALLHDIGHYAAAFASPADETDPDKRHDRAGETVLAPFFPLRVSRCVGLHVAAKRYLCTADPGYFDTLSPASVESLRLQGGPMTAEEARAFEAVANCRDAVRVRRWDEAAKVAGCRVPGLAHYEPLLRRLIAG